MGTNINKPANILGGSCEFAAETGPRAACKHLAALCFSLLDYDRNKLYEACTQRQLRTKYKQQSTATAFFLLPQKQNSEFLPIPSRITGRIFISEIEIIATTLTKCYADNIYLSYTDISSLEQATRRQASSTHWHEARKLHISSELFQASEIFVVSSSNFYLSIDVHDVAIQKEDFTELAQSIIAHRSKIGINTVTCPCGLIVDPVTTHLWCSPDALVMENFNNTTNYGLVERKCVYANPGDSWNALMVCREHFCLERSNGQLHLRTDHPYYYQLITIMGVSNQPWIDLCVLENDEVRIERFYPDANIWSTIRKRLTGFYFNVFLEEVSKTRPVFFSICNVFDTSFVGINLFSYEKSTYP
ncbi:unnamed protein product [Adineta ricciae]|uniref:YqaJ viral recombinase domain-containing protein n=1 Tax=Adineta ricciae TaxID=249248 RepID=A0A814HSC4_ADIRI|nr:unnamed protein product [Adineta ricciae]CAF1546851.1 unnamed protein product [Adineta ricciae]